MKILAIGTSGKNCTVAITEDAKVIKEININDGLTHSQNLLPTIDKIFRDTSMDLKDMDYYACSIGPGSFTGIRIGVATIKGLCLGVDKKVVGVPSLLALAYNVKEFKGYIVSCIDARNDNVYAGIYDNTSPTPTLVGNYISDNVQVLVNEIQKLNGNFLIVGDGVNVLKDLLSAENIHFAEEEKNLEYASSIAMASIDMINNNQVTDGVHISPLYLKKSQAERELDNKI
jgi:tRNA threonylcarbamoyladenosine biosynthesis protein TsaB